MYRNDLGIKIAVPFLNLRRKALNDKRRSGLPNKKRQVSRMEFTPRLKQILQVLLREDGSVSVKYLAEQVGVSKRTVQRELEDLNHLLKGYEVQFLSKTGVGVWLEGNREEKERLLQEITRGDNYDVSNREERRKRLLLEILKEKGFKKLYYYSSQFEVSEATISADLDFIAKWLNQYELFVIRKPGSGIAVEGSEENFRKAIRAFINENIDTKVVREAYEESADLPEKYKELKKKNFSPILDVDITRRVVDCIMGMNNTKVLSLTENSYIGLIIHISIAISRILKNEVIESNRQWEISVKEDEDYQLAQAIVKKLEKKFEIQIPEVELSYICLHIKGAKHEKIQWDGKEPLKPESREIQHIVNDMINAFDKEQAYLLRQDDEFIQGLLVHLQPTLIRLIYGMQIQNPILADIQKSYPEIYLKCKQVAKVLEDSIGKPIPEEEIGFLAVHFGAAIVRLEGKKEEVRKVHVGVVCSSGIGISRLMSSKLEKVFRDRMNITAYGTKDITPYVAGKTDFFISSIPIDVQDTPVVYVNPLLNKDDMEEIRRMTYKYERISEKYKESDEFSMQLEEINLVAAQINTIIKYMKFFKVDSEITFEELLIAVGEKMSPYLDRQEMIREALQRREQICSQIFAEFGFALLHARTKGVIRPEFAVCMPWDLEKFKKPYFKEITTVFIMLIPEDDNIKINTDILGYISSRLIEQNEFMEVVSHGQAEEIRDLLSRYLKKFFYQFISGPMA